jgi:hypothetical protein
MPHPSGCRQPDDLSCRRYDGRVAESQEIGTMPGPEEQEYELEPSKVAASDSVPGTDSPRSSDRPTKGSAEDLEQRQNGLPHGHPSSRFNDDGTPKPALVPLMSLELPEQGEEREHNGAGRNHAGRDQAAKDGQARSGEADRGQAENGQADSGQADSGTWADPPGVQETAARESAVTKADVWAPVNEESQAAEPADPEPHIWEPAEQEREGTGWAEYAGDGLAADVMWAAVEHESAARDQELTDDAAAEDQQPDHGPGPAEADVYDAGAYDEERATQGHEPITDDPAAGPAEPPEAKRAEALTPEQVRIAVRAHGRCRLAEGRSVFGTYDERGLTPAMRRIEEELDHGKLVPETEMYALKSLDRFQEKLAKQIERNPDKSPEELAHEIHDGVRYTLLFDEDRYYDATWQAHSKLEEQGFDLEVRRNTWTDPEYKGINSRWHDPTHDTVFEVQFHTEASWDAKQRTHDAYQKISDTTIPSTERTRLRDQQKEVSATVPLPPRCTEIPDYRKEGK